VINTPITTNASLTTAPNPSSYGQTVTLTGAITSSSAIPTGNLNFMDGAALLASVTLNAGGTATFTTSSLSVGTHSLQASYPGNSGFGSSTSATVTQTVNPAATTTLVSGAPNPSYLGTAVTFTVTVTSTTGAIPNGSVSFKLGSTVLGTVTLDGTGVAHFTTSALTTGNTTVTVVYNNTANFVTSTNTVMQTVNQLPTSTSLVSSLNPSGRNNVTTFTATVLNQGSEVGSTFAGTPTGSVTFFDGTTVLATSPVGSAGQAAFSTKLKKGSHMLTAKYSGDTSFVTSTSPVLVQVEE
jgi:hypothetical protein